MKCPHCGAEMNLRQEHCQKCGKKAVVDFDMLTDSVHEDKAKRVGDRIEAGLKWALLALLFIGATLVGVNMTWNRTIVFDGSATPVLPSAATAPLSVPNLEEPYKDPRPEPPLPIPLETAFGYRTGQIKDRLRESNQIKGAAATVLKGNAPSIRLAVEKGLKWLENAQQPEGSWPVAMLDDGKVFAKGEIKADAHQWGKVGVTALCLMAFLGEGETWKDKSLDELSKYRTRSSISYKAVKFLLALQDEKTGRFRSEKDKDQEETASHFMYNQGMATMALCEAYGLVGDPHVKEAAQKGLKYIEQTQAKDGGWNYHGNPDGVSDTSLSAWQVQALVAGKEAGLEVSEPVLEKALKLYKAATQADGRVYYNVPEPEGIDKEKARPGLQSVSLMIRLLLGEEYATSEKGDLKRITQMLLANSLPSANVKWGPGWVAERANNDDGARAQYDPYQLYFATHGMYYVGGEQWERWNAAVMPAITTMQAESTGKGKDEAANWRTNDIYTLMGGTCYSTALSIMTLQVYYRRH